MPEAMVKLAGIHKRFGELEVLRGVNLEVAKGEVVCILGPSGSGKSTLLRCVNLLEPPEDGEGLVRGRPGVPEVGRLLRARRRVAGRPPRRLTRRRARHGSRQFRLHAALFFLPK